MKSTEECLEALAQGKTLVNITGGEVYLNKFGTQVKTNIGSARKGVDFRFSHPGLWHIKETVVTKCNNFMSDLVIFLVLQVVIVSYLQYTNALELQQLIEENNALFSEVSEANRELSEYKATKEYIMELGASEDEAMKIIKASGAYSVSAK